MRISPLPLSLTLMLTACASQRGQLEPRAYEAIERGASKVEMHLGAGGKVEKVEIYHTTPDRVPEAVRRLADEQLKGGKIKSYEHEIMGDGAEIFEVEAVMPDGVECEVSATPQGALLYRECHVPLDKAPDAIKKAALAAVNGELLEVEHKQGPGLDEYSVEIRAAGGEIYKVKLGAAGQVLARSRKLPAQIEIPVR